MEGLIGIVVLAVLALPVLAIIALVTALGARSRVGALEDEVARLRAAVAAQAAREPTAMRASADGAQGVRDVVATPAPTTVTATDVVPPSSVVAATPPTADAPAPTSNERDIAASMPAAASVASTIDETAAPSDPATPDPNDRRAVFAIGPAPRARAAADSASTAQASTANASAAATPPPLPAAPPRRALPPHPPRPPRATPGIDAIRGWFTTGNLPVKVGILFVLAGVAALLKYVSDAGLLRVPVELRLAGVGVAAIGALVFGWRQRNERRVFGLAVQGGAIGVLMLVLYAAAKLYTFVPVGAAFAGTVALVAGTAVLAVRQNALALAVFAVLSGFLAPIWLSTGQGSHVALFGYYAVLNLGIVAIAARRPWRLLNLLGFAFTFGVGAIWGALRYRPEDFASTEPFLLLFFAIYLAVPILYAALRAPGRGRVFDGSLLFGTPLVAFVLQAGLLHNDRVTLAFCALALAAIYLALAVVLRRRAAFAELVAPYAVLAAGFATLAVPLALSARATSAVFALEGAGLVWLGLRQQRVLPQLAGIGLQLAAAFAFAVAWPAIHPSTPFFNGTFMAALLLAIGGFATAFTARRHGNDAMSALAFLWGLAWWFGITAFEVDHRFAGVTELHAMMLLVVGSGWVASELFRRLPARGLALLASFAIAAPVAFALALSAPLQGIFRDALPNDLVQPLAGLGALAWLVAAIAGARGLRALRATDVPTQAIAHVGWLVAWATLLSVSLHNAALRMLLGGGWSLALLAAPWIALLVADLRARRLLAWPFGDAFEAWRPALTLITAGVCALAFVVGLMMEGNAVPLPFVPVANPLELMQVGMLLLLLRRIRHGESRLPIGVVGAAAFAWITTVTLRAMHQLATGIPWNPSMLAIDRVQMALTLVWSAIGMAAWVVGSRRMRRSTWLAGAVLMGVVMAKLLLIDRHYLGNLAGIGSFIAFGLLCTVIGYLAPVPPRHVEEPA